MNKPAAERPDDQQPPRLLVSACLLGQPVRYDGQDNHTKVSDLRAWLQRWQQQGRLVPVCPETLGGLPTPRPAAEITNGDGHMVLKNEARVITRDHQDISAAFIEGARCTLNIALRTGASFALMAARSPSCGNETIYDGSFEQKLKPGMGVTTAILEQAGIQCFNPGQGKELIARMETDWQ